MSVARQPASPFVTVYIPSHNYGRFLRGAVESVQSQSFASWELVVVDDGSTDETSAVASEVSRDPRVRAVRNEFPIGLRGVANQCFALARGDFLMRLDADDLLHPRALELLAQEAASDAEVGIVFPDFFYIDERGRVAGVETLPRVSGRYEATSIPPHGAGSLIRTELVRAFGGLDETLSTQDGHELWIQLIRAGATARHVPLPLFYYRQHPSSLSTDQRRLLSDRAMVKRKLSAAAPITRPVVGVLTVSDSDPELMGVPFVIFEGEALLHRAVKQALEVDAFRSLVVSTDSDEVVHAVRERFPEVRVTLRAPHLRGHDTSMRDILREVADELNLDPSTLLCVLNLHTPFRRTSHIIEAIDNFNLFPVDSVVSVHEEQNLAYQMGQYGLEPVNPSWQYKLRRERDAVYIDNSAVRVFPVANLEQRRFLGGRIGHVLMSRDDAFKINTRADVAALQLRHPERTLL